MPRALLIPVFALCAHAGFTAQEFPFRLREPAEVVADLELSSPGSDWGQAGREAALAAVSVDQSFRAHVLLYAGPRRYPYSVFLGRVPAGEHRLAVERQARYSAAGAGLEVAGVRFREFRPGDPYFPVLAHAPILYARANTIGGFTDIPLVCYCERLQENGQPLLRYTFIYSNEDGGTSTRALMARWGRTTDIDYVYKAFLDARGNLTRATIQGKDHKELDFQGRREGTHPALIVSTDNNMISDEGQSAVRYQIAPLLVDLAGHSREQVMDEHPITYQVMAQELRREKKLRPFGTVAGENVSDPRNYLYLGAKLANRDSGLAVLVRRRGEDRWRSSDLGRLDYALARDGWVRIAIELPPGTRPSELAEIAFQCMVAPPDKEEWPLDGLCRLEAVSKVFFLGPDYAPGLSLWSLPAGSGPWLIPSGEMRRFGLAGGPQK